MGARKSTIALSAVAAVSALTLSACGGSGSSSATTSGGTNGSTTAAVVTTLAGAGASSAEAAQGAWTQNFMALNPGSTVTYDAVGSGRGREQLLNGAVQFAGTDSALKTEEIDQSSKVCLGGNAFDIPVYVSPIAVVYKLDGVKDLQLSPATLAGIFAGTITTWDAKEIKADNPDATLPSTAIVPVHRSDKSGTTKNFTDYLAATAPSVWTAGAVEEWPTSGGQSGDGTTGLISTVEGGTGTIGYADASKAGNLSVAKIKVGDTYVNDSVEGAAKVVEASPRDTTRDSKDIVVEIDRTTTDSSSYPLVLVSYLALCDTYKDQATADGVKAYASYIISADGQKAAAEAAGSAPLSDAVRAEAQTSIDAIKAQG